MSSATLRPSIKDYYLQMLDLVAARSTCVRRAVAAIITDKDGHVLSTGYNGVPRNFDHCTILSPCLGAHDEPGNTENCLAVHAEANALLQCTDLPRAYLMYCSNLPCFTCAKMIANTEIEIVICKKGYSDERGLDVLMSAGMIVEVEGAVYDNEESEDETGDDGESLRGSE